MLLLEKIIITTLLSCMLFAEVPAQALPFHAKAKIVGFTRVVRAGQLCSVTVQTEHQAPFAESLCKSQTAEPVAIQTWSKRADAAGTVNWSWQMVEDAQAGERIITVKCIGADNDETIVQKKMKVI